MKRNTLRDTTILHAKLPRTSDRRVKLTDNDVEEIKNLYFNTNITLKELAKKFNCSIQTIRFKIDPQYYEEWKEYRKSQPNPTRRSTEESRIYTKELIERKKALIKDGKISIK